MFIYPEMVSKYVQVIYPLCVLANIRFIAMYMGSCIVIQRLQWLDNRRSLGTKRVLEAEVGLARGANGEEVEL